MDLSWPMVLLPVICPITAFLMSFLAFSALNAFQLFMHRRKFGVIEKMLPRA